MKQTNPLYKVSAGIAALALCVFAFFFFFIHDGEIGLPGDKAVAVAESSATEETETTAATEASEEETTAATEEESAEPTAAAESPEPESENPLVGIWFLGEITASGVTMSLAELETGAGESYETRYEFTADGAVEAITQNSSLTFVEGRGTYGFDGGKGTITSDFGDVPFSLEGDRMVLDYGGVQYVMFQEGAGGGSVGDNPVVGKWALSEMTLAGEIRTLDELSDLTDTPYETVFEFTASGEVIVTGDGLLIPTGTGTYELDDDQITVTMDIGAASVSLDGDRMVLAFGSTQCVLTRQN